MKLSNYILLLLIAGFIIVSAFKSITPNQVIIHATNVSSVVASCNKYYAQGYRVKFLSSQSVATSIQTANNTTTRYPASERDLYGEVIIIMEK